jgi:hypothetical protein
MNFANHGINVFTNAYDASETVNANPKAIHDQFAITMTALTMTVINGTSHDM